MASYLILVVMVLYFSTSISLFIQGQPWLALTFLGYAFSNIGLYYIALGGK